MATVNRLVAEAVDRSLAAGLPWLSLPPLLLVGPPGAEESHWARAGVANPLIGLDEIEKVMTTNAGDLRSFDAIPRRTMH